MFVQLEKMRRREFFVKLCSSSFEFMAHLLTTRRQKRSCVR